MLPPHPSPSSADTSNAMLQNKKTVKVKASGEWRFGEEWHYNDSFEPHCGRSDGSEGIEMVIRRREE
ncbi:hypothetical protein C4D60_Mb07t21300 [Musa balbisiana]|uniref:Uncharacterized protein n=1 Tax=Musa balbisiana TaxID=52838 RepID=A0A4S8JGY0_MUSBA|nr:hypothetical protein C4D60_Mb07t21300 [Musa balbisiana]